MACQLTDSGTIDQGTTKQLIRLEWVAPIQDTDGNMVYDGAHAAHPHWHIDHKALWSESDLLAALELLTAEEAGDPDLIEFDSKVATAERSSIHGDSRWLTSIHLAAHADWMNVDWDGNHVPGPHQSCPHTLKALTNWWIGSLAYVVREIVAHG